MKGIEAEPEKDEPVSSDDPTVILSGQLGPVMPPAWGRLAAGALQNSYVYDFPAAGHGVLRSNDLGLEIRHGSLNNPVPEPDASCIGALAGPELK